MALPSSVFSITVILLFLPSLFFKNVTTAAMETTPHFTAARCIDNGNYTENSIYHLNLNTLLSNLTVRASINTFYDFLAGSSPNLTYGLFLCRGDLSLDICQTCVQTAALVILELCPNQKEAIIFYRECTLHYANRSIFGLNDPSPLGGKFSPTNVSDPSLFSTKFPATVDSLIDKTVNSSHLFATQDANFTAIEHLYTLAQCTPGMTIAECRQCLQGAFAKVQECCMSSSYVMIFYPSCQLRYDMAPFVGLPI